MEDPLSTETKQGTLQVSGPSRRLFAASGDSMACNNEMSRHAGFSCGSAQLLRRPTLTLTGSNNRRPFWVTACRTMVRTLHYNACPASRRHHARSLELCAADIWYDLSSRSFADVLLTISDSLNTTLCASISHAIIEMRWSLKLHLEQSLISKRQLPPIPVLTAPRKVYSLHFRHMGSSKSCFAMLRAFRLDCSASSL